MNLQGNFQIGEKRLLMTVTSFFLGEVTEVDHDHVQIKNATWIGCTGEFKKFLAEGTIEAYDVLPPDMLIDVYRQSMVNSMVWPHALPGQDKRKKGGK
jgi:hypothetical protein